MNKNNYIDLANKADNLQIKELKKIKKVLNKSKSRIFNNTPDNVITTFTKFNL